MSFLPDDDHKATLAATLAFIDECDYHSGDDDLTSNGGFSSGNDVRSTDDESDGRDDDELRPHRRVRGGTAATAATAASLPPKTTAAATVDLFATTSSSAKRPSLRVVIRTTNNKRLTAAAPPTATTTVSTAPHRLAEKPVKRTSARAPMPMERPAYPNKESVLRFRARKKAEAERLRTEVVELEAEVAKLRKRGLGDDDERDDASNSAGGTNSPSDASHATALTVTTTAAGAAQSTSAKAFWMDQAIQQARERYKSETLNQQLKEAIAKQRTMSSALQTLLVNMADTRTAPAAIVRPVMCIPGIHHTSLMCVYTCLCIGHRLAVGGAEGDVLPRLVRVGREPHDDGTRSLRAPDVQVQRRRVPAWRRRLADAVCTGAARASRDWSSARYVVRRDSHEHAARCDVLRRRRDDLEPHHDAASEERPRVLRHGTSCSSLS